MLVLTAIGLKAWVVRSEIGFAVFVAAEDAPRARAALTAYARENRRPRKGEGHAAWKGDAPLVASMLLVGGSMLFYLVTGPAWSNSIWFERGSATSEIVDSAPWRAITALTLHVDPGHVLANAATGALLFTYWFRVFGPGVGALLVLASGALGNLLNAALHPSAHASVGASTAVFGAVGLLVGAAAVRRRSGEGGRRRPWVALAAGLGLLALLGTGGVRTDLWAHAFGLLVGAVLGAMSAAIWNDLPRPWAQWSAVALLVACVVGAWQLALA
jgi:membrane associated rhomboid family serine protease